MKFIRNFLALFGRGVLAVFIGLGALVFIIFLIVIDIFKSDRKAWE